MKLLISVLLLAAITIPNHARAAPEIEVVVQTGLIQPVLLQGGNAEIDVVIDRFVIGYSHGFNLNMEGDTVAGDAADQGLAYNLPFSTGLGVGYELLSWLDIRAELKWNRFQVHYDKSRDIQGGEIFSYDTFTLGAGAYSHWRPFDGRSDWLSGVNMSTSLRFWPKITTTLDNGEVEYDNEFLGERATHVASNIGIADTPFVVNVSVGYAFEL